MPVTLGLRNHQFCYTGYVPAPGDLVHLDVCGDPADLVVQFVNTIDVEAGTDALDTVAGWRSWLSEQGLGRRFGPGGSRDLTLARELRDDLRALASGEPRAQERQVGIRWL